MQNDHCENGLSAIRVHSVDHRQQSGCGSEYLITVFYHAWDRAQCTLNPKLLQIFSVGLLVKRGWNPGLQIFVSSIVYAP